MNLRLQAAFVLLFVILASPVFGQGRGVSPASGPTQGPITVVVRVTFQNGGPLTTNAQVSLKPDGGGFAQERNTNGSPEAQFELMEQGQYEVEVRAAGYQTERTELIVDDPRHAYSLNVVLLPESSRAESNPTASSVGPKARKEMEKGIAAIKSSNYGEAKKHLLRARRLAPGDSDINYLLGFVLVALKQYDDAQPYLTVAITLDAKNTAALVTLGRLDLEMGHLEAAVEPLKRAVSIDPANWQGHWLLADTYRREADFAESIREAQLAIESGKGAADGARLVLGQALAGLGKKQEAIKVLGEFLPEAKDDAAKQYAEWEIATLQAQVAAQRLDSQTTANVGLALSPPLAETTTPDPIARRDDISLYRTDPTATLPSWKPPSVSASVPKVTAGVACPAATAIEAAGAHVTELVAHLNSIDATEELIHQTLDEIGRPIETNKKSYDYLVTIGDRGPGNLQVSELRNGTDDPKIFPGGLATLGVPALALVFHPYLRGDYEMACEGLGDLDGQPAWILHFVQKSGRPGRLRAYRINGVDHVLSMEGRAWIAKDSFQILRVETDLVHPMPEIELVSDHMEVNYEAVYFRAKGETYWLPSSAQMYFEFRKQRYRRSVILSHYRLFAVGANQRINQPEPSAGGKSE